MAVIGLCHFRNKPMCNECKSAILWIIVLILWFIFNTLEQNRCWFGVISYPSRNGKPWKYSLKCNNCWTILIRNIYLSYWKIINITISHFLLSDISEETDVLFWIVRQLSYSFLILKCTFKSPTANKENRMMIPTWMFLVVAIVLAIVIGRLGTVLKERFVPNKA